MVHASRKRALDLHSGERLLHLTANPKAHYLSVPSLDEPKTGVAFRVEDPNPYLRIRVSGNARVVGAPFTFGI